MSKWINRFIRIALLSALVLCMLIYLFGIAANLFDLMEMRRSNEKLNEVFEKAGIQNYEIGDMPFEAGRTAYAMTSDANDSVAVFFVHGSPGSLDAFTGYLLESRLYERASLYTYDRIGYGMTIPSDKGFALVPQCEQLYAFVQSIGANKNLFVGHSLGCSIIGRLAIDHPEIVDGLVMISAPLDPSLEPSSWWRPILEFPMIRIAIPHAIRISNEELAPLEADLEACLPLWDRIRCPVIFIHGDKDGLVPVENVEFGKRVLVNADVSKVILEGRGHLILWTEVEVIVDEIVRMIAGIE